MKQIQIFGIGCSRCRAPHANVEAAAYEAGIDIDIATISDLNEMAKAGVFVTPALAIDGEIVFQGTVPSCAKLRRLFK